MSLSSNNVSTLSFYKLPINLMGKNFVLEDIESYLARFTPVVKSNFQWQRPVLEKKIKVNLSQDYSGNFTDLTKYNYLKIALVSSDNTTGTYYYFIRSANQIAQSTIEFDIVMDVLNTFHFDRTTLNSSTYKLSPKSLITREHKNRVQVADSKYFEIMMDYVTKVFYEDMEDGSATNSENKSLGLRVSAENLYWWVWNNAPYEFAPRTKALDVTFTETFTTESCYFLNENLVRISNSPKEIDRIHLRAYKWNVVYGEPDDKSLDITIYYRDGTSSGMTLFNYRRQLDGSYIMEIKEPYMVIPEDDSLTISCGYGTIADLWDSMFNIDVCLNIIGRRYVTRIIDNFNEGIQTTLFKTKEQDCLDGDDYYLWYVIYASQNAVVSSDNDYSAKYVNPVDLLLVKNNTISKTSSSANIVSVYTRNIPQYSNRIEVLKIKNSDFADSTSYVEINGRKYYATDVTNAIEIEKRNNDDLLFAGAYLNSSLEPLATNFGVVNFYNIEKCELWVSNLPLNNAFALRELIGDFTIGSSADGSSTSLKTWRFVNLTDPLYIKAIEFPYCPVEYLVGKSDLEHIPSNMSLTSDYMLKINSVHDAQFKRLLKFLDVPNPLYNLIINDSGYTYSRTNDRNIKYESKLYHSDFYQEKFVYDSFSYSFYLEFVDVDKYIGRYEPTSYLMCQYKVSTNVLSKFAFTFYTYYKKSNQDYDSVLVVDRNNEKALFNNAYINYIRSGGFNHDTKKANTNNMVSGITTALSIAGSVASFVSTPVTGAKGIAGGIALAGTAMTSITRGIANAQQQDRDISYKLNQMVLQGTSVSASEDVDIFDFYSSNKAKLVKYEPSEAMKSSLWDLFHLFGYACNEYKIPVVNTRCNFNFVQGEVILEDYTFNEDIAREIVKCWRDGVTFMHYNTITHTYDFKQEYENFETVLL